MQTPLEIAFHGVDSSPSLEADIRDRAARLDEIYDRITSCRVSIEGLHHQHRTGNIYEAHVVVRVPGHEIVSTREPHHPAQKYAHADMHSVLRDAFKTVERKLVAFKRQQNGEVKPHEAAVRGQISQLDPSGEFGFLLTNTGVQLYFHRNSLMDSAFEDLKRGALVHYVQADGDTGPTASKVWLATGGEGA